MQPTDITFLVAYFGGIIGFFSPCLIPLLPSYFTIITGYTFKELCGLEDRDIRKRMFLSSIFFVVGFSFVYAILGATGSVIGSFILKNIQVLIRFSGIVLIVLGLIQLGIISIHSIQYDYMWNIQKRLAKLGYFSAFVTGIVCAFIWMPCVGQILSAILLIAAEKSTALNGFLLLLTFSFGLGTPFLILGLFFPSLFPLLNRSRKVFMIVNKGTGIILVLFGFVLLINQYQFFLSFFQLLMVPIEDVLTK